MSRDYLSELEFIGFTARIKRLSDNILYDAKAVYKHLEMDIQPNWHLVFLVLKEHGQLSVTQISKLLGFSHPAVIKIVNKMKDQGYLESHQDSTDQRIQLIQLSDKAITALPKLEKHWELIKQSIQEFVPSEFMEQLTEIETKLNAKSLFERCQLSFKSTDETSVEIVPYEEKYASGFAQLNYDWLEKYFYIEDYDREVLTNPQKHILNPGGYIFIAQVNQQAVGTVALIKRENGSFELSKMAVTEEFQGLKIGRKLMEHCISFAKEIGCPLLFLDSNTLLTPAINLYRKVGFEEIPTPENSPYERCNIRMELPL